MNGRRAILVLLLGVIVAMNYFGEIVAMNDGAGWDGVIYRDIVLHIEDDFFAGGINKYHMHRFLPFAIVHFVLKWTGLGFDTTYIYKVCAVTNIVWLAVSVFYFFRLSRLMRWQGATETIGFACLFFNFHVLKYMGYYPLLTDMMALMLSCMAAFYAFRRQRSEGFGDTLRLIAVGVVSLMVWPVLSMVVLGVVALPGLRGDGRCDTATNWTLGSLSRSFEAERGPAAWERRWWLCCRWAMVLWSPLFFVAYVFFRVHYRGVDTFRGLFVMRPAVNIVVLLLAAAVWMMFVWRAMKPLTIDWKPVFSSLFKKRNVARMLTSCLVFVLLYKAVEVFGGPSEFSFYYQLVQMSQFPLTDILIFIETHALYLGLFFVLIVLCWKDICRQTIVRYGLPFYVLLLMTLFFVADIETRKLTAFFPFLLVLLMGVIDEKRFCRWVPCAFVAVQLMVSFCWWPINVDGIAEAFQTYEVDVYMEFPAQRYFMFQGPWQSHEVYLCCLAVELLLMGVIVLFHRKRIWYQR